MNEIFKDIKGYEGMYQISNLGRVKSLARMVIKRVDFIQPRKERIRKLSLSASGYFSVVLCKNKIFSSMRINRLVASAFIPNPDNKKEVNHIDSDKTNNNVNNLEWTTRRENVSHGKLRGKKSSKYIGVTYRKLRKRWEVSIQIDGKREYLGGYKIETDAYQAYLNALMKYGIKNKYATTI